jgi:hypothetical protein
MTENFLGEPKFSTWTVDGKPIDVVPGQALCIPPSPADGMHPVESLRTRLKREKSRTRAKKSVRRNLT